MWGYLSLLPAFLAIWAVAGIWTVFALAVWCKVVVLHSWVPLRSASASCEWAVAMLLFSLFGLLSVDFSCLDGCTLFLQAAPGISPPPTPASPSSVQIQLSQGQ
nr:modulator of macroautophagy TMEM150B [Loxodonta africana]